MPINNLHLAVSLGISLEAMERIRKSLQEESPKAGNPQGTIHPVKSKERR